MPYYNVGAHTLYQSVLSADWNYATRSDPFRRACAWVEAENTFEVWNLVQQWFELMEKGAANDRYPDPLWDHEDYPDLVPLTQELADRLVEEMDADFHMERNRLQGRMAPEFTRLAPHARMAFAQDIYRITLSESQIEKRAEELVKLGFTIPPLKGPAA